MHSPFACTRRGRHLPAHIPLPRPRCPLPASRPGGAARESHPGAADAPSAYAALTQERLHAFLDSFRDSCRADGTRGAAGAVLDFPGRGGPCRQSTARNCWSGYAQEMQETTARICWSRYTQEMQAEAASTASEAVRAFERGDFSMERRAARAGSHESVTPCVVSGRRRRGHRRPGRDAADAGQGAHGPGDGVRGR
jgi:hypothetical protein